MKKYAIKKHVPLSTGLYEHGFTEHPRPQLRRDNYELLDGYWDYEITDGGRKSSGGRIRVPFSPESDLSGVGRMLLPNQTLVYTRRFDALHGAGRTLLHFGAVDHICTVMINGHVVGGHEGGYLPFSFDITGYLNGGNELTVTVTDPTDTGEQPRGKQMLRDGKYFYTPQSGMWQSVWLERVPEKFIESIKLTPDIDNGKITLEVFPACDGEAEISYQKSTVAHMRICNGRGEAVLPDPHLWSPESPNLYDMRIGCGEDTVDTYFGMRKISIKDKKLCLNNKPYFQTGVLDQGYWPESLMTPPSDNAMIKDILLMKEMGFNMLRKHLKVEPARWYYHCDRLGMLVWQDVPSGGRRYSKWLTQIVPVVFQAKRRDARASKFGRHDKTETEKYRGFACAVVDTLYNAPSIVVWSIFNEGWGQFDSHNVTAAMRSHDGTRLFDATSGWFDQSPNISDFCSVHNYFRKITVPDDPRTVALTEFGGYSYREVGHEFLPGGSYGYKMFSSREDFSEGVTQLYESQIVPAKEKGLAACIYTQLSDVEKECNGLVTYDRKINKADPEKMAAVNAKLKDI